MLQPVYVLGSSGSSVLTHDLLPASFHSAGQSRVQHNNTGCVWECVKGLVANTGTRHPAAACVSGVCVCDAETPMVPSPVKHTGVIAEPTMPVDHTRADAEPPMVPSPVDHTGGVAEPPMPVEHTRADAEPVAATSQVPPVEHTGDVVEPLGQVPPTQSVDNIKGGADGVDAGGQRLAEWLASGSLLERPHSA